MYHLRLPNAVADADGTLRPDRVVRRDGGSQRFSVGFAMAGPPGSVELFRQAAFKGEALVPVVPTAYAVILVPDAAAATSDPATLARRTSEFLDQALSGDSTVAARVQQWVDFTLVCTADPAAPRGSGLGAVILADASRLAAADPGAMADVYSGDSGNIVLDLIDATARCPRPFDPAASQQHAVCLPCDPRASAYEPARTAWYALPTCLSCLDRLERPVSGLPARTGGPCRCTGGACFCHGRGPPSCRCCAALRRLSRDVARRGAAMTCAGGCGIHEDLWACLVCGAVGCSRYRAEHAKLHWEATGHQFALSLASQQIWDYAADSLAHRLIVAFDADEHGGAAQPFVVPDRDADLGEASPSVAAKLLGAGAAAAAATDDEDDDADDDGEEAFARLTRKPTDAKKGSKKKNAKKKQADLARDDADCRAWSTAAGGGTGALPTSFLVDAKVESKVEELCLEYSRLLASQLDAQRRHLASIYHRDGDAASAVDTASVATTSVRTPSHVTDDHTPSGVYASFDSVAARASARWGVATNATMAAVAKASSLEAETAALEEEERTLSARQDALKAQVHAGLLRRHEAAAEKKKRVAELREMIAEAELNLQARRRVEARGLSAADQASSFAAVVPGGQRRGGAGRRRRG